MRCSLLSFWIAVTLIPTAAPADKMFEEAIEQDRQRIEGTWMISALTIGGKKAKDDDVTQISVVNGSDGSWSVRSDGKEISKGSSTFDPTKKPKAIDFTPTEGGGKGIKYRGIYQLGKNRRKLCFAPPEQERPSDFSSPPGSQHILVILERVRAKQSTKQRD